MLYKICTYFSWNLSPYYRCPVSMSVCSHRTLFHLNLISGKTYYQSFALCHELKVIYDLSQEHFLLCFTSKVKYSKLWMTYFIVGVNNWFPKVGEFILFLTLSFGDKYFVNDLLRITTILQLYFEYLDFKTT